MDVFLGKLSEVRRLRLGHCWSTGVVVIPLRTWWWVRSKLEMWTCPNLGALEVVILKDLKRKLCDWLAGLEFRATEMLDQRKNKFTRYIFYYLILLLLCLLMLASRQNVPVDFQLANLILATSGQNPTWSFSQRNHETNPQKKTPLAPTPWEGDGERDPGCFSPWDSHFWWIFVADFSKGNIVYHQPMDGQAAGSLTVALPDPRLMIAKLVYKPHENYSYKYHKP